MSNNDISKNTIEQIADLALLELTEEEKERFSQELNSILGYFKKLKDLDTTKVEPTRHPIEELKNVFREDEPWEGLSQEEALKNANSTKEGYIKAPRILDD
ncbi:MAG: Aspartyl/glutamyl-tRNA(Asn/Gln) amidotransferase subunit C [Promethearchaeota archaeon]|nr:MAG: Aspartyl/glutamyl-tRNA(Asn/Gln) amidotransferase subunit C [Candidatus Lokiarchaeota archaeon]